MGNKDKKIDLFKSKLNGNSSELEKIIYTDAIALLNNDVNPDKVQHWVETVLNSYTSKPKPLSEKDKKKMEEALARKIAKKQEAEMKFELLNNKMRDLLNEYEVAIIGFFNWKELSDSEYEFFETLVKGKGYFFTDFGDGALEPFITKKEVNKEFFKIFNEIEYELVECQKNSVLNEYRVMDLPNFRSRILELV